MYKRQSLDHPVGLRDGPQRHHSLAASLDWSYGLLPAEEAALLCELSVFPGGFDVDGASVVCGLSRTETALALSALVAKSLLAVDVGGADIRYRLLATTRSYCLQKMRETGGARRARARHAAHGALLLERGCAQEPRRAPTEAAGAYGRMLDGLRSAHAGRGGGAVATGASAATARDAG